MGKDMLEEIGAALARHGLILRGGFHAGPDEPGLDGARTILLAGNAGGAMWDAFAPHIDGAPHPLDRWTRRVIDPLAKEFGARPVYPFGPDAGPFQRWALRADTLYPSPIGILIHPEYGLWHAFRAALLFAEAIELPAPDHAANPCLSCEQKPCLSACPVGAFSGSGYDVAACAGHIARPETDCVTVGCHARDACPVGHAWRYPEAQIRFHMQAFARSVAAAGRV